MLILNIHSYQKLPDEEVSGSGEYKFPKRVITDTTEEDTFSPSTSPSHIPLDQKMPDDLQSLPYTKFDFESIPFLNQHPTSVGDLPVRLDTFSVHSVMDYRGTKETSTALDWNQFKAQHHKRLISLGTEPDPESLVQPGSCTSLPSLLSKLQISSQPNLGSLCHRE